MTTLVHAVQSVTREPRDKALAQRALVLGLFTLVVLAAPGLPTIARDVMVDSYLEISVFVAATLALVFGAEVLFKADIGQSLARHPLWQVPAGAALGLMPGCGGAIVAVTQFTRGTMSFGSLVATLIATAGDAMFLLLAAAPGDALIVMAVSVAAAVPFGYLLDAVHGQDFLRPANRRAAGAHCSATQAAPLNRMEKLWVVLMVPAALLSIPATMANIDMTDVLGTPMVVLALAGAALSLLMWVRDGNPDENEQTGSCHGGDTLARQVIQGTNFVAIWVVFAMVGYETVIHVFDLRLETILDKAAVILPLAAVAIGFIPGCGPQVLVASLYTQGLMPMSAQIGNSIANDGDALFPALAVAPKAAAVATLYSAIPALLFAYGWFALFE